jgi:hypothetical protein
MSQIKRARYEPNSLSANLDKDKYPNLFNSINFQKKINEVNKEYSVFVGDFEVLSKDEIFELMYFYEKRMRTIVFKERRFYSPEYKDYKNLYYKLRDYLNDHKYPENPNEKYSDYF